MTGATVYGLFAMRARTRPQALALVSGPERLDYRTLLARVDQVAADLAGRGVVRGDRVAILSENTIHYTAVQLACAKLGAMAACQNWRLADSELAHCLTLVSPKLLLASARYMARAAGLGLDLPCLNISTLGQDAGEHVDCAATPEDGLLIIYTSGTTGLPKAAVISHRAEIARMSVLRMDLGWRPGDAYLAWAPMFHMGGTEHLLATLMAGDTGIIVDGFDVEAIVDALEAYRLGWLLLVPATIEPLLERLSVRQARVKGVGVVGCMADLVPAATITALCKALDAPFLNSFGATETGMPPLSAGVLQLGNGLGRYPKQLSSLTELELVNQQGGRVQPGETGEARVRGATLFSGYWQADGVRADAFHDGWFHMGDLFRNTGEGYEFVGRSKYLIKSGGENIYPAEIERVLLADARIADAVVVRRPDERWGECPVAVVVPADAGLDADAVLALCGASLASYKRPRDVVFAHAQDMPRSASGKIIREAVEAMLADGRLGPPLRRR